MNNNVLQHLQSSLAEQYCSLQMHINQLHDPSAVEAVHQTRIAMRSLRSLLRPWKEQAQWFAAVDGAAAELGRCTSPLRDRQVLIRELEKRGLRYQVAARQSAMHTSCLLLGSDLRFDLLLMAIMTLQMHLTAGTQGYAVDPARLDEHAQKLRHKLVSALRQPGQDLHEIRINIKKLRYLYEAYSDYLQPSADLSKAIKRAQDELGEWHDNLHWLMVSEAESDLRCCRWSWQQRIDLRALRAHKSLKKLRKSLLKGS